jgi:hypothetical protein
MDSYRASDVRAVWRSWAQQQYGGTAVQLDAAADAAVVAAARQAEQSVVMDAAHSAWVAAGTAAPSQAAPAPAPTFTQALGLQPQAPGVQPQASIGVPSGNRIRGRVGGVQVTQLPSRIGATVWTIRVAAVNRSGANAGIVTVELRGRRVTGQIVQGDVIEFAGKRQRNGIVRANRIYNITSGTTAQVAGRPLKVVVVIFNIIVVCVFLTILAVIVTQLITASNTGRP